MYAIRDFKGNQFAPGQAGYKRAHDQYATSSYPERNLQPGEIYQPADIEDIKRVVKAVNQAPKKIAIAVRTGGHQYSGASSTGPENIQLDLGPTFRRPNIDLHVIRDEQANKVYVKSSVSWSLKEFLDFLQDHETFVPTGQCTTVCLGGHVQTGGYGMLARSFGLLGDYIEELYTINHDGEEEVLSKMKNPQRFYGFLGGSPGNMGILTHFKVEVQEDSKHMGSKGLWIAFAYKKKTLNAILDILVEKAQDEKFERNYDLGVNIVSREFDLLSIYPGSGDELKDKLPKGEHMTKTKKVLIVVYAQWVNFDGSQFNPELFDRIKAVDEIFLIVPSPEGARMSQIASMWLFEKKREYDYPYVKRTNTTNSKSLKDLNWAQWFTGRIHEIVSVEGIGMWISSQLQVMGGENSVFSQNSKNGTYYGGRDTTLGGTWDVFYQEGKRAEAEAWQKENDDGALDHFSKDVRRLLWGSYGNWDMDAVWETYYEPEKYKQLQGIRYEADPEGIFTPNPFAVKAVKKLN
jgi:FAD/FMN-containing dehydrogenase